MTGRFTPCLLREKMRASTPSYVFGLPGTTGREYKHDAQASGLKGMWKTHSLAHRACIERSRTSLPSKKMPAKKLAGKRQFHVSRFPYYTYVNSTGVDGVFQAVIIPCSWQFRGDRQTRRTLAFAEIRHFELATQDYGDKTDSAIGEKPLRLLTQFTPTHITWLVPTTNHG